MMMPLRRFAVLALLSAFLALPTGCAAIAKWLPVIINSLGQAAQVLDAIEPYANAYFAANPDADTQQRYARAMGKARSALSAAHAAAKGGDAAARQDVDTAFEKFRKAYQDVLAILGPLGVVAPSQDGSLSAAADGPLSVPPPDALTLE